ncbi:MAG: beta-lactamase family protein [Clostridia bacterium]|nr:beta-lactamase family protein [Clostridia bacterium]
MKLNIPALSGIEAIIRQRMAEGHIPGASAAVWVEGEKVYETYAGIAKHDGTPVGPETIFRLASMTKPFTAVAVMQQVEAGRLGLFDMVEEFIPELAELRVADKNEAGEVIGSHPVPRPVTVIDCLTHSSGIACGKTQELVYPDVRIRPGETLADCVPRYKDILLDFDPGTNQIYSPIAAPDVCARIVEILSGETIDVYFKNHITDPLGMTDTVFALSAEQRTRLAEGFGKEGDVCVPTKMSESGIFNDLPALYSGGGGLFGTLDDYGRFASALACGGKGILTPESIGEIRTPRLSRAIPGISRGFNWGLLVRYCAHTSRPQPLPPGCWGWSGAFGTHFFVDPTRKACAVLMANTTTAAGSSSITCRDLETAYVAALAD